MSLNSYVAEKRLRIFDDLKKGFAPSEGEFSEEAFRDAKTKGHPQMGATRYEPRGIYVEFIYPDPLSTSAILTVKLTPPERIVFMPVPAWVVESIWQGDIDGSYHFESDARRLVDEFRELLSEANNPAQFEKKMATGRQ